VCVEKRCYEESCETGQQDHEARDQQSQVGDHHHQEDAGETRQGEGHPENRGQQRTISFAPLRKKQTNKKKTNNVNMYIVGYK
jgi:hypothetical protein